MRIQHNIAALNSYRQLNGNNNALSKNLEKLSSGYRINRAGDDAAGLAISEKMRSQIKGLEAAQKNANDGISLVQTAEGALTEVHSMLNRMTYLATQSANGTYDNDVDRANLQKEVTSLLSEIDRVSEATNFNGINLLDGSLGGKATTKSGSTTVDLSALKGNLLSGINTVDATKGTFMSTAEVGKDKDALAAKNLGDKYEYTFEYTDNDGKHQKKTISFEVALADGKTDAAAANSLVLKASDGSTYAASGTAAKISKTEISAALKSELAKDADFAANFKVAEPNAPDGKLGFTAINGGTKGATLTGITETVTTKADGKVTNTSNTVVVGQDAGGNGTAGVSTAVDAFKTLDMTKAKIWDGSKDKLEDSIFEINGQKFAFIQNGVTVSDEMKKALSDAGVGNNFVQVAAKDTIANDDVKKMATAIGAATGLKVETGEVTVGATNTWAKQDGTTIALRDAENTETKGGKGLTLQIGDTADDFNKLTVSVDSMSTKSLGIDKIDISTQDGAAEAVKKIKDAINTVSSTRGDLGAIQNRLEHTINNLGVTTENITAAESRIRDTDMADEMMAYTKNNILVQAAQAMLAQANQVPQGVLQLLQ